MKFIDLDLKSKNVTRNLKICNNFGIDNNE